MLRVTNTRPCSREPPVPNQRAAPKQPGQSGTKQGLMGTGLGFKSESTLPPPGYSKVLPLMSLAGQWLSQHPCCAQGPRPLTPRKLPTL